MDRDFVTLIATLGDGYTARDLSDDLHEMERKLHKLALDTGQKAKGEIKLSLKFETDKTGVCTVQVTNKMTLPKKPTTGGIMFHDLKTDRLSATNPKQMELGTIREVPRGRRGDEDDDDTSTH